MNSAVKEVVDFLLAEADKVKKDCPMEITRLNKYHIVPSNMGGRWDQCFTIMVFAEGDMRQMSAYQLFMLCRLVDRPEFDIVQMKTLFRETVPLSAEFVMTCGYESVWENVKKVIAVMDSVETKADFKELVEALNAFVTHYHNWVQFTFPWSVGELMHTVRKEDVEAMAKMATA